MNCQRIHDRLLLEALHDDALPPQTAAEVRAHLSACAACRAQLATLETLAAQLGRLPPPAAPSERMRARFHAMLAAETAPAAHPARSAPHRARVFRLALRFAAACALFVLGLFIGARFLAPKPADTPAAAELAALRAQVDNIDRLVTHSLLQQKSTGERLQSVLATLRLKSPDRRLLTDLVGTLAFDPSVNVRLSAVEALAPHTGENLVRAGLIASLSRETAPLVQVAMIELLAAARDAGAAPVLARLMLDDRADPSVRETARRALAVLDAPPPDIPANDLLPRAPAARKTAI